MGNTTGLTPTKAWLLRVREKTIKYYLQGHTNLRDVAARISKEETRSVHFTTVHRILRKEIAQWDKDNKDIITSYKLSELRRIDHLEAEAWAGFQRSCMPVRILQKKETPIQAPKGRKKSNLTLNEQTETIRESPGDKRFLDTVQWCIDKRLEVMASMAIPAAEADKPGTITSNTTVRQIIFKGRSITGPAQTVITNDN